MEFDRVIKGYTRHVTFGRDAAVGSLGHRQAASSAEELLNSTLVLDGQPTITPTRQQRRQQQIPTLSVPRHTPSNTIRRLYTATTPRPHFHTRPRAQRLLAMAVLTNEEIEALQAAGKYPTEEQLKEIYRRSRLNLPTPVRLPLTAGIAFLVGLSLGTAQGSKMAGMRFRAEHAHKLPDTTTGWYLYHKSKNYHSALGGLIEGAKMGARVAFWTTAMFSIENMFDKYRGTADMLNTVTSCVAVAGGFSLWSARYPPVPPSCHDVIVLMMVCCRSFLAANGGTNHQDRNGRWLRLRRTAGRCGSLEGSANWLRGLSEAQIWRRCHRGHLYSDTGKTRENIVLDTA